MSSMQFIDVNKYNQEEQQRIIDLNNNVALFNANNTKSSNNNSYYLNLLSNPLHIGPQVSYSTYYEYGSKS
jgi:hypothetical protein